LRWLLSCICLVAESSVNFGKNRTPNQKTDHRTRRFLILCSTDRFPFLVHRKFFTPKKSNQTYPKNRMASPTGREALDTARVQSNKVPRGHCTQGPVDRASRFILWFLQGPV
jgi:hypothetical protein